MGVWTYGHIISTGTCWVPLDPSVGINSNTKSAKFPQTTVHTDRHIILAVRVFYPMDRAHMHCAKLQAMGMITKNRRGRHDSDMEMWTGGQRDRHIYNLDWDPLGPFGPQCGDKYIAARELHTGI